MDEVRTLARAGEQVGRALGTGIQVVRKRTEKKLAKRGLTPHQLSESVAGTAEEFRQELGKRGRKARKELAKATKQAKKDLGRRGRKARKQLAERLDPTPKRRRKWPFVMVLLGAAGAAVAFVLSRRPQEVKPVLEEEEAEREERPVGSPSDNGHRPETARTK